MAHETTSETYTLPPGIAPVNEGHTPAAWAMFWAVTIGLTIAAVGFTIGSWVLTIVGLVALVAGLLVSRAMRRAGKGQPLEQTPRRDWYDD